MCKYTSNPYCHGHELVTQNLEHSCNQLCLTTSADFMKTLSLKCVYLVCHRLTFFFIGIIINMLYSNTNYTEHNYAYFHNINKTASAHMFLN